MRPQLLLPLCWAFVVLGAPPWIPRIKGGGGGGKDRPDKAGGGGGSTDKPEQVGGGQAGGGGPKDDLDQVPPYGSPQQYIEELLPGEEGAYWACMMRPAEPGGQPVREMAYCIRVILDARKQEQPEANKDSQPPNDAEPPNDPSINKFSYALDGIARKFNTFRVDRTPLHGLAEKLPRFRPGSLSPMLLP